MGGKVSVSSVLGEGAVFKIKLSTKSIQKTNFKMLESKNDFVLISKKSNETVLTQIGFVLNNAR